MRLYVLKFYWNAYEQRGGYVEALWREQPTFAQVKSFFEDPQKEGSVAYFQGRSPDALYGMLSRGEEVSEYPNGGGDSYAIVAVDTED